MVDPCQVLVQEACVMGETGDSLGGPIVPSVKVSIFVYLLYCQHSA